MPLNLNIPQPTQTLGQTNQAIRDNFTFIDAGFNQNHVDFNSGVDSGKHKFLQLPQQAFPAGTGANAPTTGATELALFCQASQEATSFMDYEIFFRRSANVDAYPITDRTSQILADNNGWTALPSGIYILWGKLTTAPAGNITINFNGAGPASDWPVMSTIYHAQATATSQNNYLVAAGITAPRSVSFIADVAAATQFRFIAFGVK